MFTLMLLAALAAALIATAEVAARWWVPRRTPYRVWSPGKRLELRQDLFPDLEPRSRIEINADGERGSDAGGAGEGLYRILVAGGSAVECFALDQATSWPAVLEQLLNRPEALDILGARRVHVGNIGRSGVGAAELDSMFEHVLPRYDRIDAIIVMLGPSNAYHWFEEGAPPGRPPAVVPELALFARHPQRPFGWNPRAWALVELVRRLRQALLRPVEVMENPGAWQIAARTMRAEAAEIRTTAPDPSAMLKHFEHHFRRALRRAMAGAPRVFVVRQPWFDREVYTPEEAGHFWHGGVGKLWTDKISVYFSLGVINQVLRLIDQRVVTVADELGLPHVNLRPLLNLGLRHFYDHLHFTPEGAAVAAGALAAALLGPAPAVEQPPVRRGSRPSIRPSAVSVASMRQHIAGDIGQRA